MNLHHEFIYLFVTPIIPKGTFTDSIFFLYLGPQTVLPLASIIAALVGIVLMFWRLILRFIKKIIGFVRHNPVYKLGEQSEFDSESIDPDGETKEDLLD